LSSWQPMGVLWEMDRLFGMIWDIAAETRRGGDGIWESGAFQPWGGPCALLGGSGLGGAWSAPSPVSGVPETESNEGQVAPDRIASLAIGDLSRCTG
jgi:hypothetical protein